MGVVAAVNLAAAGSDSLVLRPYADQRIWQTVFDASETIQWRWEETATKAVVTVSNRVINAVLAPVEVVRAAAAKLGGFTLPSVATAENGEAMITLTVVQQDGSSTALAKQSANLTLLPQAITVDRARRIGRTQGPCVVAYDAAWADATGATGATMTFAGGDAIDLGSTSGWFVQAAEVGALRVDFTGTDKALTASISLIHGFLLFLR